jgi:hypothetical protein
LSARIERYHSVPRRRRKKERKKEEKEGEEEGEEEGGGISVLTHSTQHTAHSTQYEESPTVSTVYLAIVRLQVL